MTHQALVGKATAILDREARAKEIRVQVKALEEQARGYEGEAKAWREEIFKALIEENVPNVQAGSYMFRRELSPPKVVFDPEVDEKACTWKGEALPPRYVRTKSEINKSLLSAELKAGESVGFARLEVSENLVIERYGPEHVD